MAHQCAEVLHHHCVLGGPQGNGTETKVAHKRAEKLHHAYVPGVPRTRGQSSPWPTGGRKCYVTPAFSGLPKQGDNVKGGPQVGGSAESSLRSRGSPNKAKGGPQVGTRATSTCVLQRPVQKGTETKVAHMWAEVLHHRCLLGGAQTGGQSQRWPPSGRKCYITLAVSGVPIQGDKVKRGPQVGVLEGPLQKRMETKLAHKKA